MGLGDSNPGHHLTIVRVGSGRVKTLSRNNASDRSGTFASDRAAPASLVGGEIGSKGYDRGFGRALLSVISAGRHETEGRYSWTGYGPPLLPLPPFL